MPMRFFIIITIILFITGCTKDFNLDPQQSKPVYVIEGRISNLKGPYYVRVTMSNNSLVNNSDISSGIDDATGVQGAEVTITDDNGAIDTLIPVAQSDTNWNPGHRAEAGFYASRKLSPVPGHTYYLKVRIGNDLFESSSTMPASVPAIDSVQLRKNNPDDPDGANRSLYVYFSEPQNEVNYYMMDVVMGGTITDVGNYSFAPSGMFDYLAFDDKTLPVYVDGLPIRAVVNQVGFEPFQNYPIVPFDHVQARLLSINKESYNYFKALEKQFVNDGNTYHPSPASASGNISNGALGIFWATNISIKNK